MNTKTSQPDNSWSGRLPGRGHDQKPPSLADVNFLTVAEVALIMRVSKMTVYRLVKSGELEAIRVGRSFRVPEQAVNQYLKTALVGAAR